MRGFIHHDQIAEKLEIARTIGILTDYFIGPSVQRPDTSVWVSRNPNVSDEAVKNYLIRLLHGFVLDHQIIVTAPMATRERTEPGNGTAVAVCRRLIEAGVTMISIRRIRLAGPRLEGADSQGR